MWRFGEQLELFPARPTLTNRRELSHETNHGHPKASPPPTSPPTTSSVEGSGDDGGVEESPRTH